MLKNAHINREVIKNVAVALGELNDQVIYVGGATVGLYINDSGAEDVRPTKDVDISLSLASTVELEGMRALLVSKGFDQRAESTVICRFMLDDINVDVMNTKAIGWAPSDVWYEPGFRLREEVYIDNTRIFIMPLAYFLASKFEAFNDRGSSDPRTSHDFEDIVYVLDNRTDILDVLRESPEDVSVFLKSEFTVILKSSALKEALFAHLYYDGRDIRGKRILNILEEFCG
jgi:predicted nucleotidyltransferase